jgi:hypothetical protein
MATNNARVIAKIEKGNLEEAKIVGIYTSVSGTKIPFTVQIEQKNNWGTVLQPETLFFHHGVSESLDKFLSESKSEDLLPGIKGRTYVRYRFIKRGGLPNILDQFVKFYREEKPGTLYITPNNIGTPGMPRIDPSIDLPTRPIAVPGTWTIIEYHDHLATNPYPTGNKIKLNSGTNIHSIVEPRAGGSKRHRSRRHKKMTKKTHRKRR